jgi:hypothetical protein
MKKEKTAETLLVLSTALVAAGLIFKIHGFFTAALILGLIGVFFSGSVGLWIAKIWFKFAEVLGQINGRILLSLIFFLVLTPVAFLKRMLNKSEAELYNKKMDSYYFVRNHNYKSGDFENTW